MCLFQAPLVTADDAFGPSPSWAPATYDQVRKEILEWLADQPLDASNLDTAQRLWPDTREEVVPEALLLRLAETFAIADPAARQLVTLCNAGYGGQSLPDRPWLTDEQHAPLFRHNLRLLYGRWLAQNQLFDESLRMLADLQPADVVDPAALLFFQAVAHQRLVQLEQSQSAVDQLLERENELPRRYQHIGRLVRHDLSELSVDSLDHIARRMEDVRRRLDLGRTDDKLGEVEQGVIESLDKLIKQLEDSAQSQSASAGSMSGGAARPAPDSQILPGKGEGKIEKKDIGNQAGWGNLPPKTREEAMQQIGREFPSHYRDVIEQYFRKLASED